MKVAVTSSRRASELAHLIRAMGGEPYIAPTVGIEVSPSQLISAEVIDYLRKKIDIAIFMTGPGTEAIFASSRQLGLEEKLIVNLRSLDTVVARSAKPKAVLTKYGIVDNVILPVEATFEGIASLLKGKLSKGTRVAVFWHGGKSEFLVNSLTSQQAEVIQFVTYSYSRELRSDGASLLKTTGFHGVVPPQEKVVAQMVEDLIKEKIDAITFTSPPAVSNLFMMARSVSKDRSLLESLRRKTIVVSIGPSTTRTLRENGVEPNVEPDTYKMGKMIESLSEFVKMRASNDN